jgi:hypothetical protein
LADSVSYRPSTLALCGGLFRAGSPVISTPLRAGRFRWGTSRPRAVGVVDGPVDEATIEVTFDPVEDCSQVCLTTWIEMVSLGGRDVEYPDRELRCASDPAISGE